MMKLRLLLPIFSMLASPALPLAATELEKASENSLVSLSSSLKNSDDEKLEVSDKPSKPAKKKNKLISKVEESKDVVLTKAVSFANWVDHFFGQKEDLDTAKYDYLRLVNNFVFTQGETPAYSPRIKAKVFLPQLNNRTSLLFSNDRKSDIQQLGNEDNENDTLDPGTNEKLSAAINYQTDFYARSRFDFRLGLDSSIDVFAFVKHSLPLFESETFQLRNYNYFFWEEAEGFGISSQLELNHVLDKNNLFRWRYTILRSQKSNGNEWKNKFSLVNKITSDKWIAYQLDINGDTAHRYDVEDYRISVRYRNKTSIDWLYFEVEPEIRYLRTPDLPEREMIPGITLRFEIQFEKG